MYLDTIAMAKRLEGPYKEVFEKASMYSLGEKDAPYDKMMELFDMLMEAQEEGKPVDKIVGDDIEAFCKKIFHGRRRYLDDINAFQWLHRIAWVCLAFTIWDFWDFYQTKASNVSLWSMNLEVSYIFIGVMAGFVSSLIFAACVKYGLEPLIFKKKKMKPVVYNTVVLLLGIITFGFFIYCAYQLDTEFYVNGTWMLVILTGYIAVYLIVRSAWCYHKYGTILNHNKKLKKEEQKELDAFNREISAEIEKNDTAEIMAKQFKKLQEKYERKGKGIYTQEMFAEKIRKDENFLVNPVERWTFCMLLGGAIWIYPIIHTVNNHGLWAGLVFAAILIVGGILSMRFIWKIADEVSVEKLEILNHCEAQGIDIVTYVENTLEKNDEHGVS